MKKRLRASGFGPRAEEGQSRGRASPSSSARSPKPEARGPIHVVAAALYDASGRVLIAQRPAGKHLAGRWEFPGGKVAADESEREALARELHEELGVTVLAARPLVRCSHDYGDRQVELSLWIVVRHSGIPRSLDGQRLKWVMPRALVHEDILEADRPFIDALRELDESGPASARHVEC